MSTVGARLPHGATADSQPAPAIVNLGCGAKTSPSVINIDWSIHHRLRRSWAGRVVAAAVLRGERRARFEAMRDDVVVHDLRKGIPLESATADAVYHSHVLEHIDRAAVPSFLTEIRRVLKPGGIHRVVVPDLEDLVRRYLADLEAARDSHDLAVEDIIEQMVRREAHGTSLQPRLLRAMENRLLGDARRRGETHQWMYDHLNLRHALEQAGFVDVRRMDAHTSAIAGWSDVGLDLNADGSAYKPGSLFMECSRP